MSKTEKKRIRIRMVSYTLALIIGLGAWGIRGSVMTARYGRQLAADRERALAELSAYMENISNNLDKGVYAATTPMLGTISSTVWRESTAAKTALSQLPAGHTELENIYKFLSQVGEFTMALNERAAQGGEITEDEAARLFEMKDSAKTLCDQLNYLLLEQQSGNLTFEETDSILLEDAAKNAAGIRFSDGVNDTEEKLSEAPSLIYDGPFSDHIGKKEPQMTKGAESVSEEKALQAAAEFLNIEPNRLTSQGEEQGNLPCYLFGMSGLTLAITKYGALPCYMLCSAFAGEASLTQSEAVKKAAAFLEQHGYKNMKDSYFATDDGICTVNFAYVQDEVICYTDLIKVSVSLESGAIISFDARGFIMNHTERELPQKLKYSDVEARSCVSDKLTVKSFREAVIPTDFDNEVYTYEYYCTGEEDEELLVYINPLTGYEENILILLYSDGGVLTY